MTTENSSFGVVEHDSLEQAQQAALLDDALLVGGIMSACTMFGQGKRIMLATVLPHTWVVGLTLGRRAEPGGIPMDATDRPFRPLHVRDLQEYLHAYRTSYLLPPVTLAARVMPTLHLVRSSQPIRHGFFVVSLATQLSIIDGQHRIRALAAALEQDPTLGRDGLGVVIVVEADPLQSDQDFADAARSWPLPASVLAPYNSRESTN